MNISKSIRIEGLVQGVGFRPFVYRIALKYNIKGNVSNTNECVYINAEGEKDNIENFISELNNNAPFASQIYSISDKVNKIEGFTDFSITESEDVSNEVTEVSPDIALCKECINDLKTQDHRISYPLINCTNCGPRFSIIKDMPYDRKNTTMLGFEMCETCNEEYNNVSDRRFHAQPVACNNCGPQYNMYLSAEFNTNIEVIINKTTDIIDKGGIIAIKGTGGFFMSCDATNEKAVKKLREVKVREGKPFAVMFANVEALKQYAILNKEEEESICSWRKPIVIVNIKKELATGVSLGINTVGAMLPSMPFHYMLFEKIKTNAIVLTSGNLSDEPIVISDLAAEEKLSAISDAIILYNREINNRTDDSVVFVVNKRERKIRRSRGFVPNPIRVDANVEGIFAAGAEFTNCFAIGKANQILISQHIGDLKNIETLEFYKESYNLFKRLYRFEPKVVVADLHPDYMSTRFANELVIEKVEVQHHHAHIASCMAEHGLNEKVIGVSFDGTGYGTDGNIWGGEFLICDYLNMERYSHFEYIPLPGGDKVTYEPWRTALSYLYHYFGENSDELDFLNKIEKRKQDLIKQAIDKKINTPMSSSAGRLFDAVSALLNICTISSFHAEAPMRLENCVDINCSEKYNYTLGKQISFKPMFEEIVNDIKCKDISIISAKFHNTLVDLIVNTSLQIREEKGLNKVCLSGGTFQNRILLERTENQLSIKKFNVYSNLQVPANDGGLALGQLMIGAKKKMM